MIFISVVQNKEMYDKCVFKNAFNKSAKFISIDNSKENKTIPERYNSFLDTYDYSNPDWFVFCHEDWEIKEDLSEKLKTLDKNCLYGSIGRPLVALIRKEYGYIGEIIHSNKDGSNPIKLGEFQKNLAEVGTFDCQCIIMHSSLVQKYKLRFDTNLSFDLYVEAFCIEARESYKIPSYVLQLDCHHYSFGQKQERFFSQFKYLQNKWKKSHYLYLTACSDEVIGNSFKHFLYLFLNKYLTKIFRFIYQKKITKSNILTIRIFRIPVYKKQLNSCEKQREK